MSPRGLHAFHGTLTAKGAGTVSGHREAAQVLSQDPQARSRSHLLGFFGSHKVVAIAVLAPIATGHSQPWRWLKPWLMISYVG